MSIRNKLYDDRILPVLTDWVTGRFGKQRAELLERASGLVLEIGFGSGLSLPHYPSAVSRVIGLEPGSGMLRRARSKAARVPCEIIEGQAEKMPLPSEHFDTAVSVFTLCTVADMKQTVSELRRVLRPGGKLLFLEHVLYSSRPLLEGFQRAVTPGWKRVAGGCHLDRDPLPEIERQGFDITDVVTVAREGFPNLLGRFIMGQAIRS